MSRTFGALLFYDASQINFTFTGTTPAYTRNGLGDYSLNQPVSTTGQYQMGLADAKRPFISFAAPPAFGTVPNSNEFQEVFGTAAGGPGNPMGPGFGATAALPWGVSVIDIVAYYAVGTLALTSATLGLSRNVYVENTALATTALIAATGTGLLSVTAAANACHIAKVAATAPLVFETLDNSDLLVELILVTPATSTARVYGLGMHCAIEYS
jgi:hypothetical protein